jgi:hypothetical protein
MSTKLTLSVDKGVVIAAKQYAAENGTSVSKLVEAYLSAITAAHAPEPPPPRLARWRGALKEGRIEDHKAWLATKYSV